MAMRGRKPTPTAIKKLEGNPGKRELKEEPVVPTSDGVLEPPSWLLPRAKEEWRRVAPILMKTKVLTDADYTAFAAYCMAYARWRQAEEFTMHQGMTVKTPSGYIQQRPQVSIAQSYMKQMNSFMAEFGLTPASRSRIVAADDDSMEDDEMGKLLSGKW